MSVFFVSTSEAEDETSDVAITVTAGSGIELLPFSFLAASTGTCDYAVISWVFRTNLSADILAVSQTCFFL
jgi:hypothetical protein